MFLGVSLLKRKLANAMEVATVDITRSGSTYTIKTTTPLKTHEVTFVLGMTMHETTIDGREVQVWKTRVLYVKLAKKKL